MHPGLVAAQATLGVELPNLAAAADYTEESVSVARRHLERELGEEAHLPRLSIIAFGSMARQEMTPDSDFDYLVVAHEIGPDPVVILRFRIAAENARTALNVDKPGRSGLFGVMTPAAELANIVTLEKESTQTLSRRVLVLQESLPLVGQDLHGSLLHAIVKRYLYDYDGLKRPLVPRFLLNDVVRYWRTVAVDYQAKRWEEMTGEKWGSRYIKLRTTRKLTFASMLAALFMPVIVREVPSPYYLVQQFRLPALARLAQLEPHINDRTKLALGNVLRLADLFAGWFAEEGFRNEINRVNSPQDARPGSRFAEAKSRSVELEFALEALFYSEEPLVSNAELSLRDISCKYLVF